jgi:hypothetical protein
MMHDQQPPIMQARRIYDREPSARTWSEDFELHLLWGWVVSTPEYFIMGRPVDASAPTECIFDPLHLFPRDQQNCWWIWAMAGDLSMAWDHTPYDLPLVGWEKRNRPRVYEMSVVKSRVLGISAP